MTNSRIVATNAEKDNNKNNNCFGYCTGIRSTSVSDPDSGAFWTRIRRFRIQGLKKYKMLNQHKTIYYIISLNVLLLMIKWYNYEIIKYYFR